MFCIYVSGWCGSLNRHSCTWKQNSQHSLDDDQIIIIIIIIII